MQYYLKARFQFNKNQFADLMMISGIGATLTQVCHNPSCNSLYFLFSILTNISFVLCTFDSFSAISHAHISTCCGRGEVAHNRAFRFRHKCKFEPDT